jgi:hypothetical protein
MAENKKNQFADLIKEAEKFDKEEVEIEKVEEELNKIEAEKKLDEEPKNGRENSEEIEKHLGLTKEEANKIYVELKHLEVEFYHNINEFSHKDLFDEYFTDLTPTQKYKAYCYGYFREQLGVKNYKNKNSL